MPPAHVAQPLPLSQSGRYQDTAVFNFVMKPSEPTAEGSPETTISRHTLHYHYAHAGENGASKLHAALEPYNHTRAAFEQAEQFAQTCEAWTDGVRRVGRTSPTTASNWSEVTDRITAHASSLVSNAELTTRIDVQADARLKDRAGYVRPVCLLPHLSIALRDTRSRLLANRSMSLILTTPRTGDMPSVSETAHSGQQSVLCFGVYPHMQPAIRIGTGWTGRRSDRACNDSADHIRTVLSTRLAHPILLEQLYTQVQASLARLAQWRGELKPVEVADIVHQATCEVAPVWTARGLKVGISETTLSAQQLRQFIRARNAPADKFVVDWDWQSAARGEDGAGGLQMSVGSIARLGPDHSDASASEHGSRQYLNEVVGATPELIDLLGMDVLGAAKLCDASEALHGCTKETGVSGLRSTSESGPAATSDYSRSRENAINVGELAGAGQTSGVPSSTDTDSQSGLLSGLEPGGTAGSSYPQVSENSNEFGSVAVPGAIGGVRLDVGGGVISDVPWSTSHHGRALTRGAWLKDILN